MKTQLLLAALASSVLTLLVMLLVHHSDTRMMINGPIYAGLRQNADLVADILPPPAYALEAYLVCYELLNERDPARRGALVERGKALTAEYDRRIAYWAGVLVDDVARDALLGRAQARARELFAARDRELIPALERGDTMTAQASLLHIREAYQRHRAAIDDVVQRAQAITARDEARAQDQLATSTVITYVAMVLGLLAPLSLLGLCARRIAGRLARAVGELRERGAALRTASSEVAEASEYLTRGVETQARSIEETTAALEEISTMSVRNARDASMATERTTVAASAAEGSVTRVDELVAAMEAIRTNARGIAAVIRTIDEIAFQTNMLSLNAAVEAARSGEAGLGFAIVADEVRKLADRSGHAARETTEMIDEANRRSERGTVLMAGVRESLASVTSSSAGLLEVSRQTHLASQEQARGVSATNAAMHSMDSVIAENARLAKQVSSSSVGLADHAGQLATIAAQLDALVHGERAVASEATGFHAERDQPSAALHLAAR